MKYEEGYEAMIVVAFIKDNATKHADGRIWELNNSRVTDSNRDTIDRWAKREGTIPLGKLDEFLMKYGLMLFELEQYALEHYGRDGFVDPYAEPAELVA